MKQSKVISIGLILVLMLFTVSFSVALPVLVRPFYYAQIKPLKLEESSGFSNEQIRAAYDEVLDYCTGKTNRFSAGELAYSKEGAEHFADCRKLFVLDFWVLGISSVLLLVWMLTKRFFWFAPARIKGKAPSFWTGAILLAISFVVVFLTVLDFDRAFIIFHSLFFPGKENWMFDPRTDQIITILPEVFFQNCGIVIAAVLVGLCAIYMIVGYRRGKINGGTDAVR